MIEKTQTQTGALMQDIACKLIALLDSRHKAVAEGVETILARLERIERAVTINSPETHDADL